MDDSLGTAAAPLCLPPLPLARLPARRLPEGTVDTHFHVFREGAPLAPTRGYTPQMVGLAEWRQLADAVGIASGVLVQPSVYGFDNTVLLEALDAEPDRLRGIVVLPPGTGEAELADLHRRGVRGMRSNTHNGGGISFADLPAIAARLAPFDWILQLLVRSEELEVLPTLIGDLGVTIIIDHFGLLDPRDRDATLKSLRGALDTGRVYVKLSAPYRLAGDTAEIATLAAGLVATHPERLLWGTDWPHTDMMRIVPDDADLIDQLEGWIGDAAARQKILVDNPQTLFFGS